MLHSRKKRSRHGLKRVTFAAKQRPNKARHAQLSFRPDGSISGCALPAVVSGFSVFVSPSLAEAEAMSRMPQLLTPLLEAEELVRSDPGAHASQLLRTRQPHDGAQSAQRTIG